MTHKLLYAARERFDKTQSEAWDNYIEWSKIQDVTEIAGLDYIINNDLVEIDNPTDDDWKQKYIPSHNETGLYQTAEYVLLKMKPTVKFNFLAVMVEPIQDCREIMLENYEFMGYELLDLSFEISALTNCGGFDETFLPTDLNSFGLIDDFNNAYDIANRLFENNPEEDHANTNVIAVWRHKLIGK